MIELSKQYNPKETEDKWYKFWEDNKLFSAKITPDKKPYTIVIPPPNVTGILHMGHALNNTIQDILIRYNRMQGKEALWMPGTDHAGIATQNVVEKKLAKEKLKRQDLGREKFVKEVWKWKEEYGSTIIRQLKKLGASCDWDRLRFTMDEEYSKTVVDIFVRLYEKDLIYQGNYIINWCPRCQTALSDEEAPHQELDGQLYYLKYPLKTPGPSPTGNIPPYIVVATTRPETMLGDTAVAVNPEDPRYKDLIGKILILPLVGREIAIIADPDVDREFGTGAVKVTPAHDPNDYAMGKKHGLEFINVMHPDGRMNDLAGKYKNMDRFKAREDILNDLKEGGFIDKIDAHKLSAGHCYRCHTIIEPYLSKQWFVRMKPLAKPAIDAVKEGKINFYPSRWTKVYLNWMENIQDWCISRQIWWGHRLPVYYCPKCQEQEKGIIVSRTAPKKCPVCGGTDIHQDEDVLDTWFSSWLWPFATFYWPSEKSKKELEYFYPTSSLVTAPEIIFFWVARMIMAGFEFMGKEPFSDVYIHGTVRDIEGKKMSKSLGNVIDPLEIIGEYGTDALRFSLISITAQGQDVFLAKERFEQGRNFANKIWNASRFMLLNLDNENINHDLCVFFKNEDLNLINRWILSRFYSVLSELDENIAQYRFNEAANLLYSFFWHEFCDWYLEFIKHDVKNKHNQLVMYKILEKFLRILHPFMPFITEEIWQKISSTENAQKSVKSIMTQSWPHVQTQIIDKKIEADIQLLCDLITLIRNMRTELEIPLQSNIKVRICGCSNNDQKSFEATKEYLIALAKISELKIEKDYKTSPGEFVNILNNFHVAIPLAGVIDIDKYKQKLEIRIGKCINDIASKKAMLSKETFVSRAPAEIVEQERAKLKDLEETLSKLKVVKNGLN